MSSTLRFTRTIACALCCLMAPTVARAQATPPAESGTCAKIADELGAKLQPNQLADLPMGAMLHATLADSSKLSRLGITGMHSGARVSIMRIATDKLRVEVDEMDPVPVTKKTTLHVDEKGHLSTM